MNHRLCLCLAAAALCAAGLVRSEDEQAMAVNESAAVAACKTFAEAEDIYRRTDWDSDGILEYSQTIRGNNSLYEKNAGQADLTLVDRAFAMAEVAVRPVPAEKAPEPSAEQKAAVEKQLALLGDEDYATRSGASKAIEDIGPCAIELLAAHAEKTTDTEIRGRCKDLVARLTDKLAKKDELDFKSAVPKNGYIFRVMTGQGAATPGGKKSYIVAGRAAGAGAGAGANNMTLGYAIVAFPAEYGKTGRLTFVINNTGTVYEKDLGKDTRELIKTMDYNPDNTWKVSE